MFLLFFLITQTYAGDVALDKAKEAALIQLGIPTMMKNAKTHFIGQLKVDREVILVAGIYKIVKDKAIEFNISKDSVKISTNSVGYTHCF